MVKRKHPYYRKSTKRKVVFDYQHTSASLAELSRSCPVFWVTTSKELNRSNYSDINTTLSPTQSPLQTLL